MSKEKKSLQLGMNPSTANGRLQKDIIWSLIVKTKQTMCCKCSKEMTRESFSIEHLVPWLDSEDPLKLFFDIDNISFSHLTCNISDRRTANPLQCGNYGKYTKGCRCTECLEAWRTKKREYYCPVKRREKYKRNLT